MSLLPDNIRQYLLQSNDAAADVQPVVFKNMITEWPACNWKPDNLNRVFGDMKLTFRIGHVNKPSMINYCNIVSWIVGHIKT